MEVKLYKVNEPRNKLEKTLNDETTVNGDFRGSVNISEPTISLVGSQYNDFNYCFIPELDRYYFITNMTIERKNYLICDLKVDVLQSYADKIKTGFGTAIESDEGNKYIDGYVENTDARPNVDKYEFLDKFNHDGHYYMLTTIRQRI